MAQWLVFITAYNRLLEALPVFIEINVGVRPLCLCHRCKLWHKENNLTVCTAPEFYPSRVRAASGSSSCSLIAIQTDTIYTWLLLAPVVMSWSTRKVHAPASNIAHVEAEISRKDSPKSEGVELYLIASHDVVRYK